MSLEEHIVAEYWDLYDENRNPLGRTIKRGDAFAEGEYYVCCEIWIQNSNGQMLMTQRHPDKKAGGLWEFTGGGVLAGETTRQAAVREVKEELGVGIDETDLKLLEVYKHKNYFMDIYVVKKDFDIKSLVFEPDEVVDAKWVSREEIREMIIEKKVVKSVGYRYQLYQSVEAEC